MNIELKNASGATKLVDVDTMGNRVVLYAAAFGSTDSYNDIVQKGAFAKTIAESFRKVKHLWNHDMDRPIGVPESMVEDAYGLLITSKVSDTALGRDTLTLIRDGVTDCNSIGYVPIKYAIDDQNGTRTLTELMLVEYSTVVFPANYGARTIGVKAMAEQLFATEAKLQKAMRTGSLSDETYLMLETKSQEIKHAILALVEDKPLEDIAEPEAAEETPATQATPDAMPEPEPDQLEVKAREWAAFYKAYTTT